MTSTLRDAKSTDSWVQLGLAPSAGRPGELFRELSSVVDQWRDRRLVDDFFFMSKPPGLRVRFRPAPGHEHVVGAALDELARRWSAEGLVDDIVPGAYEPEEHKFGGHGPMRHAHRMFTVDATTWLRFHAGPRRTPAWALSFTMLRHVFDAMGIGGEREHGVWAQVVETGRALPTAVTASDAVKAGLRGWWRRSDVPREDEVRQLAATHATGVASPAADWAASLHDTDRDRAVAWYVVFSWNRAGLSFGRQALLTEALRDGGDDVR
ncbi:thiopeptide-type bacteriocin biosynthesis protein [Actinophytocola oryzae]|uniref:Thiopeptide-type bacteriocin biosynthesis protein n=1 Tax=Actinophytocola oryzae TaxID=502181 RepID=A0A4R7VQF9_9PSEU|nr:thiopeptide-type bacteriocin biosynthesis protein [Actinophytocola oryzae]TDV51904.1 thiopeptide-type bacteriocin biosynthesis protein [Actinophytocola oryzae]